MGEIYITSDTHFSHANIIHYCDRPFETVREMDDALIEKWNSVVTPNDTVWHLGDVFWHHGEAHRIAPRLNGSKFLIKGNHDWNAERMQNLGFVPLTARKDQLWNEYYDRYRFLMCHRPRDMKTWEKSKVIKRQVGVGYFTIVSARQEIRLVGHEHNNAPVFIKWVRDKGDQARPIMALNMSCEHWGFTPVHINTVVEAYLTHMAKFLKGQK